MDLSDEAAPQLAVETAVDEQTGQAVAVLRGELDMTNADRLRDALAPLLVAPRVRRIVFDLDGLTFMDSSGIAVLLHCAAQGKALRVTGATPTIREVITLTGLADILGLES